VAKLMLHSVLIIGRVIGCPAMIQCSEIRYWQWLCWHDTMFWR